MTKILMLLLSPLIFLYLAFVTVYYGRRCSGSRSSSLETKKTNETFHVQAPAAEDALNIMSSDNPVGGG